MRYVDPDGREDKDDIFKVTGEGFALVFDAVFNTSENNIPIGAYQKLSNHMNEHPLTWLGFLSAGTFAGATYLVLDDMYKKDGGFTNFVDSCIDLYNDLNDFGFNFGRMDYTFDYAGLTSTVGFMPSISVSDWTLIDLGAKTGYKGTIKITDDLRLNLTVAMNFTVNCQDINKLKMNNFNIGFSLVFKSDKKCNVNFSMFKPNIGG